MRITDKCDVHRFGILTLRVLTGKRPVEYMEDDVVVLCDVVMEALDDGRVEEYVDQKHRGNFPVREGNSSSKTWFDLRISSSINTTDMDELIRILELIQCPSECPEELEISYVE